METFKISELEDWLIRQYPHIFSEWGSGFCDFVDLDEWMEEYYLDELAQFEDQEAPE